MLPLRRSPVSRLQITTAFSVSINEDYSHLHGFTLRNNAVTESMTMRCTFMLNSLSSISFSLEIIEPSAQAEAGDKAQFNALAGEIGH